MSQCINGAGTAKTQKKKKKTQKTKQKQSRHIIFEVFTGFVHY